MLKLSLQPLKLGVKLDVGIKLGGDIHTRGSCGLGGSELLFKSIHPVLGCFATFSTELSSLILSR